MSSNLGSMILELSANVARFQSDMGKAAYIAEQNAAKIEKAISGAVDGINGKFGEIAGKLVAAFGVERLVEFGARAIETADQLGKLSQKVGLSVENLSALSVQAKLSNVSMDDLQTGMEKLAKNAAAAAGGSKEQATAFAALGISLKDAAGNLRPMQDLLGDVAQKFSSYAASGQKTADIQLLMGKSAANLIPFLNDLGEKGFAEATKQAEEFGAVISGETAKRAEQFQDNLSKLGIEARGFATAVASQLLPSLDRLTTGMVNAGKTTDGYAGSAGTVATAIKGLVFGLLTAKEVIAGMETALFGFFHALSTVFDAGGELVGAFAETVQKSLQAAFHFDKAAMDAADKEFDKRAKAIGASVVASFAGVGEAVKHGVGDSIANARKSFDDLFGTFSNVQSGASSTADHLNKINAPLVANAAAAEAAAKAAQRLSEMFAKDGEILAELAGKLGPLQKIYGDYAKGIVAANAAYEKEIALAALSGNKTADLARANQNLTDKTNALMKARQEETAQLVKQNNEVQKYLDKVSNETALAGLSERNKDITAAIQNQVAWWNNLTDAQKADFTQLGVLNPTLKATQDRIAGVTGALHDLKEFNSIISEFGAGNSLDTLADKLVKIQEEWKKIGEATKGALDPELVKKYEIAVGNIKQAMVDAFVHSSQEGLRSLQSMTTEGSKAFKAMQVAIDALTVVQAISAVLNQAQGDPYTAFARMAAMAAAVVALGVDIAHFGSGGGSSSQSAEVRQQTQGAGTVLGDAKAQSDSIAKATSITADATQQLVGLNRGMLSALQSLQNALGAASVQLAQGAGNVTFPSVGGKAGINFALGLDPTLNNFLFGGSKKVIDQGIVIFGGALQDMLNSVAVGAYQTIHKSGGLFGNSKTYDQTQSVSDEFSRQFQLVIGSLVDAVKQGATALGISQEQIDAAIAAYHVAEQHISLKGLSAADQQKALEAVFSSIFDGLAAAVVPFIKQFQKVGEGLGETLVRVATEVQVTQQAMKSLGLAIATTDPEKFAQIADALTNAVGGIDAFISGMNSFVDRFATDQQKFTLEKDALTSAFSQVGLSLPNTREGLYALMHSLDASTDAGRKQIALILQMVDVEDAYYSALEKHKKADEDAAAAAAAAAEQFASFMAQFKTVHYVDSFEQSLAAINAQMQANIKQATALAIAAGKAGLSMQDLAAIHEQAAQAAAQLVIQLEAAAQQLAFSLGLTTVGSLDQVNAEIQRLESESSSATSSVSGFGNAIHTAAQKANDAINLLLGNLSPLNDQQKLQIALQGLRAGTVTADQVLQIGRNLYASSQAYTELFNEVMPYANRKSGSISGGGGGGGTQSGGLSNSDQERLKELLKEQAVLQKAATLSQYQTLAQQIEEIAKAKGEEYSQVIADMGINMKDLEKGLGLASDDALQAYLDSLASQKDSNDQNVQSIIDAINNVSATLQQIFGNRFVPSANDGTFRVPNINNGVTNFRDPNSTSPLASRLIPNNGVTTFREPNINPPPPPPPGNGGGAGGGNGGGDVTPGRGDRQASIVHLSSQSVSALSAGIGDRIFGSMTRSSRFANA